MLQHENTWAKKVKKSLVQYHFKVHFLLPNLPTRSVTFTIHQSKSVQCIEISKLCFPNHQLFTFGNKMHTYRFVCIFLIYF